MFDRSDDRAATVRRNWLLSAAVALQAAGVLAWAGQADPAGRWPAEWKKWHRPRWRKDSPYPEIMSELALPADQLPKVVPGHPRLLVRARPWRGGLSVEQLRRRASREPWASMLKGSAFRSPRYGPRCALYYLVSGDVSVMRGLEKYVLSARPGWRCGGTLVKACLVYDWIVNSPWLAEGQKQRMREHIVKVALQCARAQESGTVNDLFHHRGAGGWASDVLVAGLTLYGEHPEAARLLAWGAGYFKNAYFPGWARTGGTHMGGGHRYYRAGAGKLPLAIACWYGATEDDVLEVIRRRYDDFLQGNMYAMMYQTLPDKTRVESTGFDYAPRHLMQGNYLVTSWCYRNPDGYAFLRWLGRDVKHSWLSLLLYDEAVARARPRLSLKGPSARLWGGGGKGWFGYVQIRSKGWEPDSKVIEFKCGDRFWSHGFNTDQNSFYIYYKGRLAVHGGMYADNAYFGSHMRNYYAQTVSSNSMLIIDPAEWCHARKRVMPTQDARGFYPVYGGQRTHCGGSNSFSFQEFLARMDDPAHPFECGDIIAFEHADDFSYTYVCGDATANYNNPEHTFVALGRKNRPKIDLFTRSLAWLDNRYLVVFDRVNALDAGFRKAWLLHSQGKPIVTGRIIKTHVPGHIEDFDGDTVSITWADGRLTPPDPSDPGRLLVRTFLPREHYIRRIGGKGYEFWVDGRNWPPARDGESQGEPQDMGKWRIEVSPSKPAKFDNFLHLLYPCDARVNELPPAEMVVSASGEMIGLAVGPDAPGRPRWLVMFGKMGRVRGRVRYRTPAGRTQHLVVDLVPGTRYRVSPCAGGARELRASGQGTLRFATDRAGTVSIAPARRGEVPFSSAGGLAVTAAMGCANVHLLKGESVVSSSK